MVKAWRRGMIMKSFVLMFVVVFHASAEEASEEGSSVELSMKALSGYIWRGAVLGADDRLVFQPAMTLFVGDTGVLLGAGGSFYAQDCEALREFDELDLTLDLTRFSGRASWAIRWATSSTFFPALIPKNVIPGKSTWG